MKDFSYFDEAYFQEGEKRGTVYKNYRETAKTSPIFKEIARAMVEVFRPKRVLEIGCATGIMVKHLNDAGCDAHGIDVSEWAISHREHPNVRLASAGELPYPDASFDLVFSCHAIEHLPDAVVHQGIKEITRVCSGFQFHMLPMVGTPPFTGPVDQVLANLKKDPTHNQLHPVSWWRGEFQKSGMVPVEVGIQFTEDNEACELTYGQFMLRRPGHELEERGVAQRAFEWNCAAFKLLRQRPRELPRSGHLGAARRRLQAVRPAAATPPAAPAAATQAAPAPESRRMEWLQLARELPARGLSDPKGFLAEMLHLAGETLHPTPMAPAPSPQAPPATLPEEQLLVFTEQKWQDIHRELPPAHELDLRSESLLMVVGLEGPACTMRLALAQDQKLEPFANCLEYTMSLKPGLNWFICEQKDLRTLRGHPDISRINRVAFGGATQGATLRVWLLASSGQSILG
jgi:SAM-dependent methyltransferase